MRCSWASSDVQLTGPKPKDLIRSPKVEKLGFEPVRQISLTVPALALIFFHLFGAIPDIRVPEIEP